MPGSVLKWKVVGPGGAVAKSGAIPVQLAADSSVKAGVVEWVAAGAGAYELRAEIADAAGKTISENIYEFEVLGQ
jgi:hypothetical protein